ncbi:MAG: hypothetical protein R2743_01880 [Ilumatobacteraceae bacterium]
MGFLDDAWEWTGGALEDAGKAMMSAAEETAGVVVDGVNFLYNAAGEVVDAMGNLIIDGVTYSAGFATTVAAPIVDAAEMVEVWVQDWDGSWITDFVEKSMSAGYRLVEDAATAVADTATVVVDAAVDAAGSVAEAVVYTAEELGASAVALGAQAAQYAQVAASLPGFAGVHMLQMADQLRIAAEGAAAAAAAAAEDVGEAALTVVEDAGAAAMSAVEDVAEGLGDAGMAAVDAAASTADWGLTAADTMVFDPVDTMTGGLVDVDYVNGNLSAEAGIPDVLYASASVGTNGVSARAENIVGGAGGSIGTDGSFGVDAHAGIEWGPLPYAEGHIERGPDGSISIGGEVQVVLPTPLGVVDGSVDGGFERNADGSWNTNLDADVALPTAPMLDGLMPDAAALQAIAPDTDDLQDLVDSPDEFVDRFDELVPEVPDDPIGMMQDMLPESTDDFQGMLEDVVPDSTDDFDGMLRAMLPDASDLDRADDYLMAAVEGQMSASGTTSANDPGGPAASGPSAGGAPGPTASAASAPIGAPSDASARMEPFGDLVPDAGDIADMIPDPTDDVRDLIPDGSDVADFVPRAPDLSGVLPSGDDARQLLPDASDVLGLLPDADALGAVLPDPPPLGELVPDVPEPTELIPEPPTPSELVHQVAVESIGESPSNEPAAIAASAASGDLSDVLASAGPAAGSTIETMTDAVESGQFDDFTADIVSAETNEAAANELWEDIG